jgi:hypothetical protein
MLSCVLADGRVTAANVPALLAQPQMDPGLANLQAFLTSVGTRLYWLDGIEVTALRAHASQSTPAMFTKKVVT